MTDLGQETFAVVGHGRGSYVAYRRALDHPDRVNRFAVLDSVPIMEAHERAATTRIEPPTGRSAVPPWSPGPAETT